MKKDVVTPYICKICGLIFTRSSNAPETTQVFTTMVVRHLEQHEHPNTPS